MTLRHCNGRRRGHRLGLACAFILWSGGAAADPVDRWSREIAASSFRFGIPEQWIRRVMRAESNGQRLLGGLPIVSRAGAIGLMQLMPATWRDMRGLLGLGSDPNEPADNIAAGTFYLRLLYERFGYPGLFAAYNAGPARYSAYLAGRKGLPLETSVYVARVATPTGLPPGRLALHPGASSPMAHRNLWTLTPQSLRPTSAGLFAILEGASGR